MPFNDEIAWSDFFSRNVPGDAVPVTAAIDKARVPVSTDGDYATESGDVIRTTSTAKDARNVQELQSRIKAAGGVLTTSGESSDYLVAVNNKLKFSVTRNA